MFNYLVYILILINFALYESKLSSFNKTRQPPFQKKLPISPDSFTVIKVADGDTITVRNNSNWELVRIRFFCIDAPEKSQPKWGKESLEKLKQLLPLNSNVKLAIDKTDLYGRTVAEVINHKKENVNKKMTEIGLVAHYRFQKGCDEYGIVENAAKSANRGIWSDKMFELPWDYRKKMGIGARGKNSSESSFHKNQKSAKKLII